MQGLYFMGNSVKSLKARIRKRSEYYTKTIGRPHSWVFTVWDPAVDPKRSTNYTIYIVNEILDMSKIIDGAFKSKRKGGVNLWACPTKESKYLYSVGIWTHDQRRKK